MQTLIAPSVVDELISLELMLVTAYEQTLLGIPKGSLRNGLKGILRSHRAAAQLLSGKVDGELGTRPAQPDPTIVTSTVSPGLVSLQHQELEAVRHYEAALADDGLNPGLRDLIETAILPELRERISALSLLEELPQPVAAGTDAWLRSVRAGALTPVTA